MELGKLSNHIKFVSLSLDLSLLIIHIVHYYCVRLQQHASYVGRVGLVWIGQFLFLFSVSDFLIVEMIIFQILKFDFVSNVKKFGFQISQSKQIIHIDFLKIHK